MHRPKRKEGGAGEGQLFFNAWVAEIGQDDGGPFQVGLEDIQPMCSCVLRDHALVCTKLYRQHCAGCLAKQTQNAINKRVACPWLVRGGPPGAELWATSAGCGTVRVVPTARLHECGGLITAVKLVTPNMPRLEMLKPKKEETQYGTAVSAHAMPAPASGGSPPT